ncbi:hypothetical protein L1987_01701 [Smallanthus sonchifolius]|uniref:Uncharacterized protein n=1 Tax=Smallanthus sonchifolius TaxID=185202 RepID=A0ACB9K5Y2_9ASTR|nr:hypothetical protein L1987_01701 [Smallanthus sonchifolius]
MGKEIGAAFQETWFQGRRLKLPAMPRSITSVRIQRRKDAASMISQSLMHRHHRPLLSMVAKEYEYPHRQHQHRHPLADKEEHKFVRLLSKPQNLSPLIFDNLPLFFDLIFNLHSTSTVFFCLMRS